MGNINLGNAPDPQLIAALSGKFEILVEIGKGGMATVYKARQKSLNRLVALKIVHPNLVHDQEFLERFHREARLAASLNHKNIVIIFDVGQVGSIHYISMEYLEGWDLFSLIHHERQISIKETISYISDIAQALDYAHMRGLVHRDIKSSNIFITNESRPVLTDFGIAHANTGTQLTQTGSVVGTPEYMSPEQAEGKPLDGRSDFFSLGMVLYECLTGKVPHKNDNPLSTIHGIIYNPTPTPKTFNPQIPSWLENIVMYCVAKDPKLRVSNGIVLSQMLRQKLSPSRAIKKKLSGQTKTITSGNVCCRMGLSLCSYFLWSSSVRC